jgi:osmotically-inducible protein OsmY
MSASVYTPFALGETVNNQLIEAKVGSVICQCAGSLVVLRGQVGNRKAKDQAATIARRCCGMSEISNEIAVVGDNRGKLLV